MPLVVLEQLQEELVDYRGLGLSVMEMSHRSVEFAEIAERAESDLRLLLNIPEHYSVLFMQGGASTQFALTVQNLDQSGKVAFANTGYWSNKAMQAASAYSQVQEVAGLLDGPSVRITPFADWQSCNDASYLHITDNETINGVAYHELPEPGIPLIADMSSSILSRPIDITRYGLIYAGAQKNIGPAGITLVIIRDDLLKVSQSRQSMPAVFNYAALAKAGSMLNTPPTFSWYASGLVFQWLLDQGGLGAMAERNRRQAECLYQLIDEDDHYCNTVHPDNRSCMNIPFQLKDNELLPGFLSAAADAGILGLKGHKSMGGLRASLYNAVTDDAVDQLINFMREFTRTAS